ncbi:hypothetical protein [Pseudomonas syringae]|uniref:hypothetical protein n=1 Tax=Pseudomonas syringae TaxID=317 RepID=UPI0032D8CEDA
MTSNIKYLCIDDQGDDTVNRLLSAIEGGGGIELERWTPTQLDEILPAIKNFIDANLAQGVGLLLDLRLDMDSNKDKSRVKYRGPTLAQELRTRMAEREIPAVPIVLWSVNAKFESSFSNENTSKDLFDDVYEKDREVVENPSIVTKRLISLAKGYGLLRAATGTAMAVNLVMLGEDVESMVYAQFIDEFKEVVEKRSAHDAARLLLNELIRAPGLLIDEQLLASRLGVHIGASADSWEVIKKAIASTRYTGLFYEGWDRWWWYKAENWWFDNFPESGDIRAIDSSCRVELINNKLGTAAVPANPICDGYSGNFFSICAGLDLPLDPNDGLRVVSRGAREWQDPIYVSVHAALERIGRGNKWRLDPLERQRLDSIKDEMS